MQAFHHAPKILTGGKEGYNPDIASGGSSNQKNYPVARYAEALLLYAEACIGSSDEAAGLKALNDVQKRAGFVENGGSGKISTSLTFDDVMEEKQYELWFESTRFFDLVRWSKTHPDKVNLDEIFNTRYGGIHERIPTVFDEFKIKTDDDGKAIEDENGNPIIEKPHKLYVTYSKADYKKFEVGKHEYFPFPMSVKNGNPNLKDVGGWAYLNPVEE